MKPHQTAHWQWSILVSHGSAGSTAPGLLCLATFSSGLHIFTSPGPGEFFKALFHCPKPPHFFDEGAAVQWEYLPPLLKQSVSSGIGITCAFGTGLNSRDSPCIQKTNTASRALAFLHTWEIGRQKTSLYTGYWMHLLPKAWCLNQNTKLTSQTPKPRKTGQLTASEILSKIMII